MSNRTIIALDFGRSAAKVLAHAAGRRFEVIIPSFVTAAVPTGMDDVQKANAEIDTVKVDGSDYWVGDTAEIVGGAKSYVGMTNDWIGSVEYRALCLAAIKRLAKLGVPGLTDPYVVVGTPSDFYSAQRVRHERVTAETINGEVRAILQPMGAFLSYSLNEQGVMVRERMNRKAGEKRSWAVIEIGHYTTDFLLIRRGESVPPALESCVGMSSAADRLRPLLLNQGFAPNVVSCALALTTGKTRRRGEDVEIRSEVDAALRPLAETIKAVAKRVYAADLDELDGVLLAGGGAPVLQPYLNDFLHNVAVLENPRWAVAEGYLRYGMLQLRLRQPAPRFVGEVNA